MILEVSTATQLETLTRHLKQRRWPEPTKFRNPPWLAAFADCTSQSLQQRCSTNETLKTLRVEAQVKEAEATTTATRRGGATCPSN